MILNLELYTPDMSLILISEFEPACPHVRKIESHLMRFKRGFESYPRSPRRGYFSLILPCEEIGGVEGCK